MKMIKRSRGEANRSRAVHVDEQLLRAIVDEAMLTIAETAKRFGVSVATIVRRMRKLGLKSKKGRGSPMEKNYFWAGGRRIDDDGYIMLKNPSHPHATKDGYVREHRLVMEKVLGRYLLPTEVVHHKEKSERQNNDPSNLEVFDTNASHLRHELTGKRPNYTPDGLRRMRENAQRVNLRRWIANHPELENDVPSLP